jgi:heme-degrading monooxygenase HmoA
MVELMIGTAHATFINTFRYVPSNQDEITRINIDIVDQVASSSPGFISAAVHRSTDGTRVINDLRWESAEHLTAMQRSSGFQAIARRFAGPRCGRGRRNSVLRRCRGRALRAENRVAIAIAVGQEALNLPLLLGFVTGLHGLVGRRGGAGADWSHLAVAAGATLSAVFALYTVLWIGVVLSVGELAEPSPAFELAWQLHAAAFALALPALGTTFIGAALAAHTSRLTPPWQRLLGVAGGGLLLAAGAANRAIADGSALLFVGAARLRRLAHVAACDRRTAGARSNSRPS